MFGDAVDLEVCLPPFDDRSMDLGLGHLERPDRLFDRRHDRREVRCRACARLDFLDESARARSGQLLTDVLKIAQESLVQAKELPVLSLSLVLGIG